MVVQGPVGIRDVEAVVPRVKFCYEPSLARNKHGLVKRELTVHPLVGVHPAVHEILPGVENRDGNEKLDAGDHQPVHDLCQKELPRRESRDHNSASPGQLRRQERIVSPGQSSGQQRVLRRNILGQTRSVQPKNPQQGGQRPLRKPDARSPDCNVVVLLARHLLRVDDGEQRRKCHLYHLLNDDVARYLVARDVVAAANLLRCVQSVLRPNVVRVDKVKEERQQPVDEDWRHDAENGIWQRRQYRR